MGPQAAERPTQFIFGYGSLINTASRNSTASAPIPAIPVRVSAAFGYIRTWNDRSPSGFTALGLRKPRTGESASTINGVLYPVDGDDMSKFDAREEGYARVEIPHHSASMTARAFATPGPRRDNAGGSAMPSRTRAKMRCNLIDRPAMPPSCTPTQSRWHKSSRRRLMQR